MRARLPGLGWRSPVGLILGVVLAGCASAATPAMPVTAIPTGSPATPALIATSSPTVAPATPGGAATTSPSGLPDRVLVSGTADCGIEDLTETSEGETTVYRGTLTCTYSMSDPRVSGTETGDLTLVYLKVPALEIDRFSFITTLTTEGGTWRGSGWGSEYWDADGLHTSGIGGFVGEGAYAGLAYRILFAQGVPGQDAYIVSGWIEPAG